MIPATHRPFWRDRVFFLFLCFAGLEPFVASPLRFLPKFMTELHFSVGDVSDVLTGSGIGAVIALPLSVWLIQRAPRTAMIGGNVLQGLAIAALFWSPRSVHWFLAIQIVATLGSTVVFTTCSTVIAEATPLQHKIQGIALFWIVINVTRNIVGPACFEALSDLADFPTVALAFGSAGLLGAAARLTMAIPRRADAATAPRRGLALRQFLTLPVLHFTVAFLVMSILFIVQTGFLTSYAAERGFVPITPFLVCYSAVMLIGRTVFGHLPDRFGRRWVSIVSAATLSVFFLGMAFAGSRWAFWPLGLILGAGNTLLWPAAYATSYDLIAPGAVATAFTSLVLAVGTWAGAYIFGEIGDRSGYTALYSVAAGLALVLALLLIAFDGLRDRAKRRSTH